MTTPAPVKIALRIIGAATTGVLVLGGGYSAATVLASTTSVETVDVAADGLSSVHAEVEVGDVRLVETRGLDEVQVELRRHGAWREPSASARRVGDQLRVTGDCPGGPWGNCAVDVIVRVPTGSDLAARAVTSVGDLRVSGSWSQLDLRSDTGNMRATDLRAEAVRAHSSVGDLDVVLAAAPDHVELVSDVGDVRAVVPADGTAYDVRVRTDVGERLTTVPLDPTSTHRIDVTTSVGDVTVVDAAAPEARNP
ncbi:DUF4097 family beta strand repeat-containing protein [Thalassiella azotivora]